MEQIQQLKAAIKKMDRTEGAEARAEYLAENYAAVRGSLEEQVSMSLLYGEDEARAMSLSDLRERLDRSAAELIAESNRTEYLNKYDEVLEDFRITLEHAAKQVEEAKEAVPEEVNELVEDFENLETVMSEMGILLPNRTEYFKAYQALPEEMQVDLREAARGFVELGMKVEEVATLWHFYEENQDYILEIVGLYLAGNKEEADARMGDLHEKVDEYMEIEHFRRKVTVDLTNEDASKLRSMMKEEDISEEELIDFLNEHDMAGMPFSNSQEALDIVSKNLVLWNTNSREKQNYVRNWIQIEREFLVAKNHAETELSERSEELLRLQRELVAAESSRDNGKRMARLQREFADAMTAKNEAAVDLQANHLRYAMAMDYLNTPNQKWGSDAVYEQIKGIFDYNVDKTIVEARKFDSLTAEVNRLELAIANGELTSADRDFLEATLLKKSELGPSSEWNIYAHFSRTGDLSEEPTRDLLARRLNERKKAIDSAKTRLASMAEREEEYFRSLMPLVMKGDIVDMIESGQITIANIDQGQREEALSRLTSYLEVLAGMRRLKSEELSVTGSWVMLLNSGKVNVAVEGDADTVTELEAEVEEIKKSDLGDKRMAEAVMRFMTGEEVESPALESLTVDMLLKPAVMKEMDMVRVETLPKVEKAFALAGGLSERQNHFANGKYLEGMQELVPGYTVYSVFDEMIGDFDKTISAMLSAKDSLNLTIHRLEALKRNVPPEMAGQDRLIAQRESLINAQIRRLGIVLDQLINDETIAKLREGRARIFNAKEELGEEEFYKIAAIAVIMGVAVGGAIVFAGLAAKASTMLLMAEGTFVVDGALVGAGAYLVEGATVVGGAFGATLGEVSGNLLTNALGWTKDDIDLSAGALGKRFTRNLVLSGGALAAGKLFYGALHARHTRVLTRQGIPKAMASEYASANLANLDKLVTPSKWFKDGLAPSAGVYAKNRFMQLSYGFGREAAEEYSQEAMESGVEVGLFYLSPRFAPAAFLLAIVAGAKGRKANLDLNLEALNFDAEKVVGLAAEGNDFVYTTRTPEEFVNNLSSYVSETGYDFAPVYNPNGSVSLTLPVTVDGEVRTERVMIKPSQGSEVSTDVALARVPGIEVNEQGGFEVNSPIGLGRAMIALRKRGFVVRNSGSGIVTVTKGNESIDVQINSDVINGIQAGIDQIRPMLDEFASLFSKVEGQTEVDPTIADRLNLLSAKIQVAILSAPMLLLTACGTKTGKALEEAGPELDAAGSYTVRSLVDFLDVLLFDIPVVAGLSFLGLNLGYAFSKKFASLRGWRYMWQARKFNQTRSAADKGSKDLLLNRRLKTLRKKMEEADQKVKDLEANGDPVPADVKALADSLPELNALSDRIKDLRTKVTEVLKGTEKMLEGMGSKNLDHAIDRHKVDIDRLNTELSDIPDLIGEMETALSPFRNPKVESAELAEMVKVADTMIDLLKSVADTNLGKLDPAQTKSIEGNYIELLKTLKIIVITFVVLDILLRLLANLWQSSGEVKKEPKKTDYSSHPAPKPQKASDAGDEKDDKKGGEKKAPPADKKVGGDKKPKQAEKGGGKKVETDKKIESEKKAKPGEFTKEELEKLPRFDQVE